MKWLTTLLLLAVIVISVSSSIPLIAGTYQLYELRSHSEVSLQAEQPIPPGILPINDDGLQRLREKDFDGGLAFHYQFNLIPFLPILLLAVAFICDRRSLKTLLGKISAATAALLYITAFTVLAWIYSWIDLPQIGS